MSTNHLLTECRARPNYSALVFLTETEDGCQYYREDPTVVCYYPTTEGTD
jgi:hypothetical protein